MSPELPSILKRKSRPGSADKAPVAKSEPEQHLGPMMNVLEQLLDKMPGPEERGGVPPLPEPVVDTTGLPHVRAVECIAPRRRGSVARPRLGGVTRRRDWLLNSKARAEQFVLDRTDVATREDTEENLERQRVKEQAIDWFSKFQGEAGYQRAKSACQSALARISNDSFFNLDKVDKAKRGAKGGGNPMTLQDEVGRRIHLAALRMAQDPKLDAKREVDQIEGGGYRTLLESQAGLFVAQEIARDKIRWSVYDHLLAAIRGLSPEEVENLITQASKEIHLDIVQAVRAEYEQKGDGSVIERFQEYGSLEEVEATGDTGVQKFITEVNRRIASVVQNFGRSHFPSRRVGRTTNLEYQTQPAQTLNKLLDTAARDQGKSYQAKLAGKIAQELYGKIDNKPDYQKAWHQATVTWADAATGGDTKLMGDPIERELGIGIPPDTQQIITDVILLRTRYLLDGTKYKTSASGASRVWADMGTAYSRAAGLLAWVIEDELNPKIVVQRDHQVVVLLPLVASDILQTSLTMVEPAGQEPLVRLGERLWMNTPTAVRNINGLLEHSTGYWKARRLQAPKTFAVAAAHYALAVERWWGQNNGAPAPFVQMVLKHATDMLGTGINSLGNKDASDIDKDVGEMCLGLAAGLVAILPREMVSEMEQQLLQIFDDTPENRERRALLTSGPCKYLGRRISRKLGHDLGD